MSCRSSHGARIGRRFTYRAGGWAGEGRTLIGERRDSTRIVDPRQRVTGIVERNDYYGDWQAYVGPKGGLLSLTCARKDREFAELAACRAVAGEGG